MAKGKLNNLLSFKDFSGGIPTNVQKKTKRTDVGLDVLNESFYDKLIYKIKNDRPLGATIAEFEKMLLKSINSGTVDDYEEKEDGHYFTLRGRNFKIGNDGTASIKTPRNIRTELEYDDDDNVTNKTHHKIWTTFDIPGDTAEKIVSALKEIDYL